MPQRRLGVDVPRRRARQPLQPRPRQRGLKSDPGDDRRGLQDAVDPGEGRADRLPEGRGGASGAAAVLRRRARKQRRRGDDDGLRRRRREDDRGPGRCGRGVGRGRLRVLLLGGVRRSSRGSSGFAFPLRALLVLLLLLPLLLLELLPLLQVLLELAKPLLRGSGSAYCGERVRDGQGDQDSLEPLGLPLLRVALLLLLFTRGRRAFSSGRSGSSGGRGGGGSGSGGKGRGRRAEVPSVVLGKVLDVCQAPRGRG